METKIKTSRKTNSISFFKTGDEKEIEIRSLQNYFEVINVMNGKKVRGNCTFDESIRNEAMNAWNLV